MAKIENDKYYTCPQVAKRCIEAAMKVIGKQCISEVVEPSAGNGSFSSQIEGCIAFDIEPEADGVKKQDFLSLDLAYKSGRLIIGNPPFGSRMNLAQKFYKKSVEAADFIAFILPISQLQNTNSLYEFDLIHSEDLGKQWYSDRELHCCFNVYKRPDDGLNTKKKFRLKDITIVRQDSKQYGSIKDYDLRMCYWGNGSAGKILSENETYSAEYKIIIHSDALKDEIINALNNVDWNDEINKVAMLKIQQFHIHELLRKKIKGIK